MIQSLSPRFLKSKVCGNQGVDSVSKYFNCPCSSKALYHKCCKPFHDGIAPENAMKLMRSRYAAYALDLPDYIIGTTHPENSNFQTDTDAWREDLHKFSKLTQFDSLTVHEFVDGDEEAFVTFTAHLRQAGLDNTFKEKSRFKRLDGRWMYIEGEILEQVADSTDTPRTGDAAAFLRP